MESKRYDWKRVGGRVMRTFDPKSNRPPWHGTVEIIYPNGHIAIRWDELRTLLRCYDPAALATMHLTDPLA